jgi:histidinol phosphatase-like PHP family hydrolase
VTRRDFVGSLAATALSAAGDGLELFNGKNLEGWRPSENKDSWKVVDGQLAADGPRSHLFYAGPVQQAAFRNFELEVEALASPGANSGIYFHTGYQEQGFPQKGFEVQINNTATGEGGYRERKKTGSLYGVRNVYKQLVRDGEWFRVQVAVRGKNIQVRLNETLLVDYTEPSPPVLAEASERGRFLEHGTFALQCHDPGSKVRFRRIAVRPLPDDVPTPGEAPLVDDVFRQILTQGARNIPLVDYHVHVRGGLTVEGALAKSRRDGIQYGLAVNCGKGFSVQDDAGARRFAESLAGLPVFVGMQAEGREWTGMFSRQAVGLFDYVFTDAMTWTDNRGRRMRLWVPEEVGTITDPENFMETLVERTVGILEQEPIDIWANPTFLPDSITENYDRLWTEERMQKVIRAAVRNGVAIELNNRYRLPRATFVRMAREAGCKFALGSNNAGLESLGRSEYGLRMVEECKLRWQDFFAPGAWAPKAVERKGEMLRA